MKVKEIRAMPVSEAESQVAALRAELAKERAVAAGGTRPENPGKISTLPVSSTFPAIHCVTRLRLAT